MSSRYTIGFLSLLLTACTTTPVWYQSAVPMDSKMQAYYDYLVSTYRPNPYGLSFDSRFIYAREKCHKQADIYYKNQKAKNLNGICEQYWLEVQCLDTKIGGYYSPVQKMFSSVNAGDEWPWAMAYALTEMEARKHPLAAKFEQKKREWQQQDETASAHRTPEQEKNYQFILQAEQACIDEAVKTPHFPPEITIQSLQSPNQTE